MVYVWIGIIVAAIVLEVLTDQLALFLSYLLFQIFPCCFLSIVKYIKLYKMSFSLHFRQNAVFAL